MRACMQLPSVSRLKSALCVSYSPLLHGVVPGSFDVAVVCAPWYCAERRGGRQPGRGQDDSWRWGASAHGWGRSARARSGGRGGGCARPELQLESISWYCVSCSAIMDCMLSVGASCLVMCACVAAPAMPNSTDAKGTTRAHTHTLAYPHALSHSLDEASGAAPETSSGEGKCLLAAQRPRQWS